MAHRRGESPAAKGTRSRVEEDIAVVPRGDSGRDYPFVTIELDRGAEATAHPPHRRIPGKRRNQKAGGQKSQMVPRPRMFRLVADDRSPRTLRKPEHPRRDHDPPASSRRRGQDRSAGTRTHPRCRLGCSPTGVAPRPRTAGWCRGWPAPRWTRTPDGRRRPCRFPAGEKGQGGNDLSPRFRYGTGAVHRGHLGARLRGGRTPDRLHGSRDRDHDRQRQRRHPHKAARLARGRRQPFQRQAPTATNPPTTAAYTIQAIICRPFHVLPDRVSSASAGSLRR